jgi:hypothetical protein
MRVLLVAMFLTTAGTVLSCKSEDQPPPQQAGYPPQQPYAQQPQQPYGAQPAATAPPAAPPPAAPVATAAPAPTVAPAPGTAPAAGQMSQPSPMAAPCTSDAQCLTHRCNTAFGKCAWPCMTNADCTPGNHCQAQVCLPGQ